MYVREYMKTEVVTVEENTPIQKVLRLMQYHGLGLLPVVREGILTGIITDRRIRDAASKVAPCTSGRDEDSLLAERLARDIMETDVVTVHPNAPVEEAIAIGQAREVSSLPVVVDRNDLMGIITITDLYKLLVQVIGFGVPGARLHVYECNRAGRPFGELIDIIGKRGIKIRSMFHVKPPGIEREDCIFHLDVEDVSDLLGQLRDRGYHVESRPGVQARGCTPVVPSDRN